jgi:hypothetical protein
LKFLAYSPSNSSQGIIFDIFIQRFSSSNFPSNRFLKFSSVSSTYYSLQYVLLRGGMQGFRLILAYFPTPLTLLLWLYSFLYKGFSLFQ